MTNKIITCNRCSQSVDFDEAECCWYCLEYLCYPCWDKHGHCGHIEADRFNALARSVEQPERLNRAIAQNTKAKKKVDAVEGLRKEERPFAPAKSARFENGRLKF